MMGAFYTQNGAKEEVPRERAKAFRANHVVFPEASML